MFFTNNFYVRLAGHLVFQDQYTFSRAQEVFTERTLQSSKNETWYFSKKKYYLNRFLLITIVISLIF
jgi:hypothetical protein